MTNCVNFNEKPTKIFLLLVVNGVTIQLRYNKYSYVIVKKVTSVVWVS